MSKFSVDQSNTYNNQLKTVIPGGVHYSFRMPWESKQIHFKNGKGTRVRDLDGNEYLDFFAKFGANILGHNHQEYNEALINALQGATAINLGTNEYEVAERISSLVPGIDLLRFSLSGTDAVQNAIRLARAYTGKNKFIRFQGHYHGNSDNLMGGQVGDLSNPVPIEFKGDLYDTGGKAAHIREDQSYLLPWNDLDVLEDVLSVHYEQVAALLMEPICINGGGIMPAANYLEGVRKLCDRYHIVLIFDEVITGFRVGLRGAQQLLGVTPDITILGKAMAGGSLPVSAIGGKQEIMKLYESRVVAHGGTFNGYPLGIAAVAATLDILSHNDGAGYDLMNEKMTKLRSVFLDAANSFGFSFEMTGPPACSIFNLRNPSESDDHKQLMIAQYLPKMIGEALAENGILVSNSNRFYGNIAVSDDDIRLFADRISPVFESVAGFVGKMRG